MNSEARSKKLNIAYEQMHHSHMISTSLSFLYLKTFSLKSELE